MKVLIVTSLNSGSISPFIKDQVNSIKSLGVEFFYFSIIGKGYVGYLSNLSSLYKAIEEIKPDFIHAHYGLSGLLCCFQFKKPLIVTFHGSDINNSKNRKYSYIASRLANECIFVHKKQPEKINYKAKSTNIVPCGVNTEKFYPMNKFKARRKLGLNTNNKYILFSSSFDRIEKNYPLAREAVNKLKNDITLLELKGYSPKKVNLLMNAVDFLLVTSNSETGPLVLKEAMACNTPAVSTDVGDVKEITNNIEGYFMSYQTLESVKDNINKALKFSNDQIKTQGRNQIVNLKLDTESVAKKVLNVYENMIYD